ncbi:RNA polymerase sigma factor [Nonomuraea sp. NPDC059023]|uniref:RNA polymerase sigma factor n=1 Tax=unclassified Nonomuraea TaxID=2593643 RepID=UPI0036A0A595
MTEPSVGPADNDDSGPIPPQWTPLTFEEGYRKYRAPLLRHVQYRVNDLKLPESVADTEGIVQEAFEKARPYWHTIDRGYFGYLLRIVDGLLSDRVDDDSKRGEASDRDREDPDRQINQPRTRSAEDVEDRIEVTARLRRLPKRQREAVWRRDIEGESSEEIGRDMGCSPEAVDSLVYRGRAGARRESGVYFDAGRGRTPWEVVAILLSPVFPIVVIIAGVLGLPLPVWALGLMVVASVALSTAVSHISSRRQQRAIPAGERPRSRPANIRIVHQHGCQIGENFTQKNEWVLLSDDAGEEPDGINREDDQSSPPGTGPRSS